MKLSPYTLSVLKNFSSINGNILIKKGSKLDTISPANSIIASATVDEEFPMELGIYDLSGFLAAYSMFDDPSLIFSEENSSVVKFKEGRRSARYVLSNKEMLKIPTDKERSINSDCSFTITSDDLSSIRKASSSFGVKELIVTKNDNDQLVGIVGNSQDRSTNSFQIELTSTEVAEDISGFTFIIPIENMKLMMDDYNVSISRKKISKFTSLQNKIEYYIALDTSSTVSTD